MKVSDDIKSWLEANENLDYASLMLRAGDNEQKRFAAMQREARRKAASKLPEFCANADVIFPTLLSVEQCTSEALARYHTEFVRESLKVADLTAGLGIDAMTFARVVAHVSAIELNPEVANALRHNAQAMGLDNLDIVTGDCRDWLKHQTEHFDVMFIDPYRRDSMGRKMVSFHDCAPDVVEMLPSMLAVSNKVVIKASPMLDISKALSELSCVCELIVTGTPTECKELIFICSANKCHDIEYSCTTILRDGTPWSLRWSASDVNLKASIGTPTASGYLYEPWPAMMKSGAFGMLSHRYDIDMIAPSTHLFVSDRRVESFPGVCYKIIDVLDFSKKNINGLKPKYTYANIATRNFPIKAPELEKKLGVKSGGDIKIFGVTLQDKSRKLIISQTCVQ